MKAGKNYVQEESLMREQSPDNADGHRFHGIFSQLSKIDMFDHKSGDLYDSEFADFYNNFTEAFITDIPIYERYLSKEGARVLDLACGSGRIGIALAKNGVQVDGLELSADMLNLVKKNLANESEETRQLLTFVQGDMCNFTLPHQYDLIVLGATSISLLLQSTQRAALFQQVRRHLKQDGKFIFDILNFSGERWKEFDNYSNVWSREVSGGQEFAIVGQRLYPDERLFVYNVYREFISWSGETKRTIGSSTKAWLDRDELVACMDENELTLVDEFSAGAQIYFVSTLKTGI
jgi:SAM-dependent methyltransferase